MALLELPFEVVCEIVAQLPSHTHVPSVARTCTIFAQASSSNQVWRALYSARFNVDDTDVHAHVEAGFDWRLHYRASLTFAAHHFAVPLLLDLDLDPDLDSNSPQKFSLNLLSLLCLMSPHSFVVLSYSPVGDDDSNLLFVVGTHNGRQFVS